MVCFVFPDCTTANPTTSAFFPRKIIRDFAPSPVLPFSNRPCSAATIEAIEALVRSVVFHSKEHSSEAREIVVVAALSDGKVRSNLGSSFFRSNQLGKAVVGVRWVPLSFSPALHLAPHVVVYLQGAGPVRIVPDCKLVEGANVFFNGGSIRAYFVAGHSSHDQVRLCCVSLWCICRCCVFL